MNGRSLLRLMRQFIRRPLGVSSPASHAEVERAEWVFYIRYLRERMVVFDVGSHVGELTLLFSRFAGQQGQVHAFEANSATFKRLKAVCQLTGRKNVVLNHLAVADKEGVVKLHVYDDEHSGWNSLAERPLHRYGIQVSTVGTQEVLATTIDTYCKKNGISQIDLLKIDVEGAEYQVLLGARRMLQNRGIVCCLFEFGQTTFDMGNDPDEFESYLGEFGYEVRNVVQGDAVFPGGSSAEAARFSMHVAMPKG